MKITRHKIYISERVVDLPFVQSFNAFDVSTPSLILPLRVRAVQFLFAINAAS